MDKRTCSKCNTAYPANTRFFQSNKNRKCGIGSWCKECVRVAVKNYRDTNPDKNADSNKKSRKKYRISHLKKTKDSYKKWSTNNPEKVKAHGAKRRATKLQATPPWYPTEHTEIQQIYKLATSLGHHVDHIIPLTNPQVCGLHTLANLQTLPPEENLAKSNKFDPDDAILTVDIALQ